MVTLYLSTYFHLQKKERKKKSFRVPEFLLFHRAFQLLSLSVRHSWFLCLIKAHTECGTTSQCSAKCWGGLQIKMPSPGCAHQAVQRRSPGRFTTYILFYGPFLIHHNAASILLTSAAEHTSLPAPSVFSPFSLSSRTAAFTLNSPDARERRYTSTRIQIQHGERPS